MEPLRVIPLDYAVPPKQRGRWPAVVSLCLVLAATCCVVAWILIVAADVESVLVTGPILFVLGATSLIGGILLRRGWVAGLGAAHCAVCLLFAGLVNALHWGPSDARQPFTLMGLFYCLLVIPVTVVMMIWDRPIAGQAMVDSQPPTGHK